MSYLEDMSLEERLRILQMLENPPVIDYEPVVENKTFRLSDYPRLRRHIIDRDTRLYDLPPVLEDTYSTYDDEGDIRDMASSVLAKRYKKNRRNRNIRTLKARDRLNLARMIEAGLPEEIGRKIARDVYNEQFGSSRRRKKKKNKKKTRRRQTIRSVEPANEVVELANEVVEYEPELNLLSLAPDIQETIEENLRNIKLQRLTRENDELIENYKNKVRGNLPLTNYSGLLNTQLGNTDKVLRYDDFSNNTILQVFKLPKDIANLLIGSIQHFELNNLQELLKFLAQDDNLNDFVSIFELTLKQSFQYTPLEIQLYINNFLTAINFRFL